jgi:hypothetical protein
MENFKEQNWYNNLQEEGKIVANFILKSHDYFKNKDKKYKKIVQLVKVSILLLAMISTIVLGLKNVLSENCQINIGLVLSTSITFLTALSSFFNFEKYWMRNISIHIELNILRDNFIYEAEAKKIDENRLDYYRETLDNIQKKNVTYWEEALKKL